MHFYACMSCNLDKEYTFIHNMYAYIYIKINTFLYMHAI